MNVPSSKRTLPLLRYSTIERPKLLERLRLSLQHKLILVAAPPGYGKTTAVIQFAYQASVPVAWLTIEERDRNLPNLHAHCVASLSEIMPDFGSIISTSITKPDELAQLLTIHIQNSFSSDLVFVLDDVHHVIGSTDAEKWLRAFVERIPPTCHTILVGQALPALPMMEMVARGDVLALGQEQLRFSFEELRALAEHIEVSLSPSDIQKIVARFDGWIAGCILALQQMPDEIETALFSGKRGVVELFEALAEVMLHTQVEWLQDFLLASSTLGRMTPTLCRSALQLVYSRERLAEAIRHNLFITQAATGLTYHPLFRDFLQRYLQTNDPTRFVDLHCRAGRWFEANNRLDEAFDHYVSAEHWQEAAAIAERVAQVFVSQGKSETVLYWRGQLSHLDEEIPQLCYACASIHLDRYQYDLAQQNLSSALHGFSRQADRLGVLKTRLQQAYVENMRGEYQSAVDTCLEILQQPDIPANLRGFVESILGTAYLSQGHILSSLEHLEAALPLYRAAEDGYALAQLLLTLDTAYMRQGRFDEAIRCAQEAVEILRTLGNRAGLISVLNNLGYDNHMLGEYQTASQIFQEGLQIAAEVSETRGESYLLWSVGDLMRDLDDFEQADAHYQRSLHLIAANEPSVRCGTLVSLATLRRWEGSLEEALFLAAQALRLADKHNLEAEQLKAQAAQWAVRAQQQDAQQAQHELSRLADAFKNQGAPAQWAKALTLCADAALILGDQDAAYEYLKSIVGSSPNRSSLQPCITEIVHSPALDAYVQACGKRFSALLDGIKQLKAARIETLPSDSHRTTPEPVPTYSLNIWLLGEERVERDGAAVPLSAWRTATARELFFYLLLKGPATREKLGLVLWPENTPQQIRGKFHSTLHRLRNAVGTNAVRFEDDVYLVNPQIDIWCDAIEFGALVQQARLTSPLRSHTESGLRRAIDLYKGELLSSFDALWMVPHREALQQLYVEALFALGSCLRARSSFREAVTHYQRALEEDPYREDIHRAILMCFGELGDRSSIHRQLRFLTRILDADLGIAPSVETLALANTLLA